MLEKCRSRSIRLGSLLPRLCGGEGLGLRGPDAGKYRIFRRAVRALCPKQGEGSQHVVASAWLPMCAACLSSFPRRLHLRQARTEGCFIEREPNRLDFAMYRRQFLQRFTMSRTPRNQPQSARDPERIGFARDQRKQANEFARDVWEMVRASRMRGQKFRREYPIPPYTVDFVCLALKLIVEVDGKGHFTDQGRRTDEKRDQFLRDKGFQVLRFHGYQVTQDPLSVRKSIEEAIDKRMGSIDAPHPQPLSPEFHTSSTRVELGGDAEHRRGESRLFIDSNFRERE